MFKEVDVQTETLKDMPVEKVVNVEEDGIQQIIKYVPMDARSGKRGFQVCTER